MVTAHTSDEQRQFPPLPHKFLPHPLTEQAAILTNECLLFLLNICVSCVTCESAGNNRIRSSKWKDGMSKNVPTAEDDDVGEENQFRPKKSF